MRSEGAALTVTVAVSCATPGGPFAVTVAVHGSAAVPPYVSVTVTDSVPAGTVTDGATTHSLFDEESVSDRPPGGATAGLPPLFSAIVTTRLSNRNIDTVASVMSRTTPTDAVDVPDA